MSYARLALLVAFAAGAQVVIVPWAYVLELARRRNDVHWDWDTAPELTASPVRTLERAA